MPSQEGLSSDEHNTAELRTAKRPRNSNAESVGIDRQPSEIANSGGVWSKAGASVPQAAQSRGLSYGRIGASGLFIPMLLPIS